MKLKKDYIKLLMNGQTYKELSEKTGISRTWLSTVINRGKANMRIVKKLSKGLGVDPEEIIILKD